MTENLIVSLRKEKLLGCVFACKRGLVCYLGKLAVHPEYRGNGIGQRLLEKAGSIARVERCQHLEVETRVELTENQRYFERLGFSKFDEKSHPGFDRPTSYVYRMSIV